MSMPFLRLRLLRCSIFGSLVVGLLLALPALADVRLPRLISDGMVLQRDKPIHVWGWADEGEQVSVSFAGKQLATTAKDGRWSVDFPAQKVGKGTLTLSISAKNQLTINNIVIGDVWVDAGQSNMELPLRRVANRYPQLIETTRLPEIREFNVPVLYNFKGPQEDFAQGEWKTATPENLANFSAVGFFFAQKIHRDMQVPIGLITIPVGGSPAEAWVSETTLKNYPAYLEKLKPFKDDNYVTALIAKEKASSDKWYSDLAAADIGIKNNWSQTKLATDDWKTLRVPGFLQKQSIDLINGAFWVRKTFSLTEAQAKKAATLWMGVIVDADQVFVNGTQVGQTYYQYPPRIYALPAGVLTAGENSISIRVTSYTGNPGFVKQKRYTLDLGDEEISLAGEWRYKISARAGAMEPTTTLHYLPSALYNAKLAPLFHTGIKGALWYQGESNVGRAEEYKSIMADMIADWRAQFKQGDFPFLMVQLANFLPAKTEPTESGWAELREAQRATLAVKNTALAVIIDVGEWNDIHPLNKQDVGERLALGALKLAYGKKSLLASGPQVKSVSAKGNRLLVKFNDVGKGLQAKGGELKEIAIAGADKKFVWATALVKKDQLVLSAEGISEPRWVRYGWADNPAGANLYNSAGLPASPFEAHVDQ
jgi:sialate O-acetylesterase